MPGRFRLIHSTILPTIWTLLSRADKGVSHSLVACLHNVSFAIVTVGWKFRDESVCTPETVSN